MSDLAVMGAMQRSILRAAATVVRPGGLLVYSTCSLEPEENDAQIEGFLAGNPEWRLEPPPAGAVPPAVLDARTSPRASAAPRHGRRVRRETARRTRGMNWRARFAPSLAYASSRSRRVSRSPT